MRRVLLLVALLAPAAAGAQPTVGLRVSWAPALGDLASGTPMSEVLRSQVPLQLDALWRFGFAPLSAGAYASWGPGQVGASACGGSCSGSAWRAGVQGLWTFPPLWDRVTFWSGLGLGWEWATMRQEKLGTRTTYGYAGPELALQGGAEWPIGGRFAVGPAVLLGLGRYARESLDTGYGSASGAIATRAVHAWVHLGVRGRVDF